MQSYVLFPIKIAIFESFENIIKIILNFGIHIQIGPQGWGGGGG